MHVGICTANLLLKELEKLNKKEWFKITHVTRNKY
jgi:hypothetical protein